MINRKLVAGIFLTVALVLGAVFYNKLIFHQDLTLYFKAEYYNQFGPLAICVELLIAGFYLFTGHSKANFALALFAFTALLDPIFNLIGLFSSAVPVYAMVLFIICSIAALFLAFSNTFNLGRISWIGALISFLLGSAVELFFNYI